MAKSPPGRSIAPGFYLIVDEKPDGRFWLGHFWPEVKVSLQKWQAVGIVKPPYTVEKVTVTRRLVDGDLNNAK